MKKFWMVLRDEESSHRQHAPSKKHENINDAKIEAGRLARMNPTIGFFVMEAVGRFATIDPTVVMEECK